MTAVPAVFAAFLAVCADMDGISKSRRVQEGPARFAFRGVDDVMNALHGPLAKHGLICVPQVQERTPEARQTRNGGTMNVVHLRVRFAFFAADGSTFHAEAWGEGQDSGDKATGKAHSMAYKSALLQAFHVPTEDTPDADSDTTPAEPVRGAQRGPLPAGEDQWQQPVTDAVWVREWKTSVVAAKDDDDLRACWANLGAAVTAGQVADPDKLDLQELWKERARKLPKTEQAMA